MSARLVVENQLTDEEREILLCFRKADIRRKREALVRMRRICEAHPLVSRAGSASPARGIRLVTSFGKGV